MPRKRMEGISSPDIRTSGGGTTISSRYSLSASRPTSQTRFIQHKKEAFWFYWLLSMGYNHIMNLGYWIEDMRDDALEPTDLNEKNIVVVNVGGETDFTTLGMVNHVDANNA
ncbi:hypothetical protein PVK06_012367 [Gossypium arboreum]|uniref:MPBQ/MBSQ family SAM-binding methyltransferase profile domain-containing protein n=1 Tax=Gossypium arboreum TaxID=29729 RepID=A0ABR0QB70_GOSAR|nr:hypothetical protein PVK06_012367 [Gossypium arboreum]